MGDGTIGAEHVDALSNATTRLDDDTTEKLLDLEDELLADAAAMSPEKFERACRGRIRRLERDKASNATNTNATTRSCHARPTWQPG